MGTMAYPRCIGTCAVTESLIIDLQCKSNTESVYNVLLIKRSEQVRSIPPYACCLQEFTWNLALAMAACTLGSSFQFGYNTGIVNAPETVRCFLPLNP